MCRYNAAMCQPYVGQMCAVRTTSATHRGRIDSVTSRGVYMTPVTGGRTVAGDIAKDLLTLEQEGKASDAEHVYWGYRSWGWGGGWGGGWGSSFFLPFLSILALTPLLFW